MFFSIFSRYILFPENVVLYTTIRCKIFMTGNGKFSLIVNSILHRPSRKNHLQEKNTEKRDDYIFGLRWNLVEGTRLIPCNSLFEKKYYQYKNRYKNSLIRYYNFCENNLQKCKWKFSLNKIEKQLKTLF